MNDKGKVEVCFKCSYALNAPALASPAPTTYACTSDEVIAQVLLRAYRMYERCDLTKIRRRQRRSMQRGNRQQPSANCRVELIKVLCATLASRLVDSLGRRWRRRRQRPRPPQRTWKISRGRGQQQQAAATPFCLSRSFSPSPCTCLLPANLPFYMNCCTPAY